jgi:hypothetical protein
VELKEAVSVLTKKNSEANLEIVALKRDKLDVRVDKLRASVRLQK